MMDSSTYGFGGFGQQIGQVGFAQFKEAPPMKKTTYIICDICKVQCPSQEAYTLHLNGKKHASKIQLLNKDSKEMETSNSMNNSNNSESNKFLCELCNVKCPNQDILNTHYAGAKHLKSKQRQDLNALKEIRDPSVYCSVCELLLDPVLMGSHLEGAKHQRQLKSPKPPSQDGPAAKRVKHDPVSEFGLSISRCGACNLDLNSESMAIMHYQSKNHSKNLHLVSMQKSPYPCEPCKKPSSTQEEYQRHCESFRHQWKVSKGTLDPSGPFAKKIEVKKKSLLKMHANVN